MTDVPFDWEAATRDLLECRQTFVSQLAAWARWCRYTHPARYATACQLAGELEAAGLGDLRRVRARVHDLLTAWLIDATATAQEN